MHRKRDSLPGVLRLLLSQYKKTEAMGNKLSKVTVDWDENCRERETDSQWDWAWVERGCWDLSLWDGLASLRRYLSIRMDMRPKEEGKSNYSLFRSTQVSRAEGAKAHGKAP